MAYDSFRKLPLVVDLETRKVLKKITSANRYLAELKGISETIPNQSILINTLVLQEAKDSKDLISIVYAKKYSRRKTTYFSYSTTRIKE